VRQNITLDVGSDDKEMISQKTKRWIAAAILLLGAILVTHRLWYELKSIPVH
jgi:hypothetical protein